MSSGSFKLRERLLQAKRRCRQLMLCVRSSLSTLHRIRWRLMTLVQALLALRCLLNREATHRQTRLWQGASGKQNAGGEDEAAPCFDRRLHCAG